MADREGLLVISECAAVRSEYYLSLCVVQIVRRCSLDGFSEELLDTELRESVRLQKMYRELQRQVNCWDKHKVSEM